MDKGLAVNAPAGPAGRKARQPKNSGGVVGKGCGGCWAQQAVAQVLQGLRMHMQPASSVKRQCVDGEVARLKVCRKASTAQGHALAPVPQADIHTFANAYSLWVGSQKIRHASVKGKIKIYGSAPKQKVAHCAANEVKFHARIMPQPTP